MDAPLSEVEASSAQAQMSKRAMVEKEIVDHLENLRSLEATVIDMKHKLTAFNTKLNETAPFNLMLPLEVISEIFDLVNENQDEDDFHALPAPFLLGRICRSWRHHAQSRPRMWSAMTICLSPSKYPVQEQLVQEWLIRSGDYDLHYNISSRDKWSPPPSFANLILQSSSRWKAFKTVASLSIPTEIMNGALFPRLSSIVIIAEFGKNPSFYDFSSAGGIKHLSLPSGCPRSLKINSSRLLSLKVNLSLRAALCMTERLVEIEKLHLKIYSTTAAYSPAVSPRVLRYLSYLDIDGDDHEVAISTYLDCITTPALTALRISSSVIDNTAWTNSLVELHKRSPFGLTTLFLHSLDVTETVYVEMLRLFPSISTLFIEHAGSGLSDLMIENLKPNLTAPNNQFLPNLMDFTYKGRVNFQLQTMIDMLEHRIVSSQDQDQAVQVQPLRSLKVTYKNAAWYRRGDRENPNQMHEFYRKMINLESRGTVLSLIYEED